MVTNVKKIIPRFFIFAALALNGCYLPVGPYDHDDDDNDNGGKPQTVRYNNLFPFENSANRWRYNDGDGNLFSIDVIDTISDEMELYFKVDFTEVKLNRSQNDWFMREGNAVYFNESLRGEYMNFLPSSFVRSRGTFYCDSAEISYTLLDTVTLHGKVFRDIVALDYTREILHGFDRVYFADGIGIVGMIDEDGRWPIEYVLDSASVNGVVYRF